MCDCSNDSCGCASTTLPIGPTGAAGTNGSNGIFGGWSNKWIFDEGTSSVPAATEIRLDSSDPSIATHIYINKTNANSIDVHSFLDSFDNNGRFGWIRLFKEYDSTLFSYHKVTAINIVGNVYDFTVDSSSTDKTTPFVDGISMIVTFTPNAKELISLDFNYATSTTPYIEVQSAAGTAAYGPSFIYEGNNYYGSSIDKIDILYKTGGSGAMIVSVIDELSGLVLAYGTINTTGSKTILELTNSNTSNTNQCICTIRVLDSSGSGALNTLQLYGLSVKFK